MYADEILGRLVQYLKSHQLYDRSTIVLLSDHGEGLGDHGEREHGLFAYSNTIRVPLIIKQEGNEGAGRRVADLVQHIDLVPTILDLVKAPAAGALRGRSLKPLLDGSGSMPARQVYSEALYAHAHFGWSELAALTDGRYQYVRAPREELYDLARDPYERANLLEAGPSEALAPDVAKAAAALRADLQRLLPATAQAATDAGEPAVDPKDKRQFVDAYRGALDAAGRGEWPRAISQLQQILHTDPDVAEAWSTLAGLSALMGRYDLALDAYHHVVTLRPAEPVGISRRAPTCCSGSASSTMHACRRWRPSTRPPTRIPEPGRLRTNCWHGSPWPGTTSIRPRWRRDSPTRRTRRR